MLNGLHNAGVTIKELLDANMDNMIPSANVKPERRFKDEASFIAHVESNIKSKQQMVLESICKKLTNDRSKKSVPAARKHVKKRSLMKAIAITKKGLLPDLDPITEEIQL